MSNEDLTITSIHPISTVLVSVTFFSVISLSYQLGIAEWFTGDIVVEAVHVFNDLLSSASPSFNFPTQHVCLDPILPGDVSQNFISLSLMSLISDFSYIAISIMSVLDFSMSMIFCISNENASTGGIVYSDDARSLGYSSYHQWNDASQ